MFYLYASRIGVQWGSILYEGYTLRSQCVFTINALS